MKDQRRLLNVCLANKVPAFILQGRDLCSIEILNSAYTIYQQNGCGKEFLFDFKELIKDFAGYQSENQPDIKLPSANELEISESAKKKLLNECLFNEIPVIVFQGTDACSIEILKSANDIYKKAGCGEEFQYDFQNLINGFTGYQYENQITVKLPALCEVEKELIQKSMYQSTLDTDFKNGLFKTALESNTFDMLSQLKEQGYQPSKEILQSLGSIPDYTMVAIQKIFNLPVATTGNIEIVKADLGKNDMKQDLQPGMIK